MNNFQSFVSLTESQLSNFSENENFWSLFETVFGTQYNHTVASAVRSQWQSGDFSQFPQIEMIDSSIFGNGNGDYATENNKIYLSNSFISSISSDEVKTVLLKQIGNFVNKLVNPTDTVEDKGAIFAEIVQKNSSTKAQFVSLLQPTISQAINSGFENDELHDTGCTCSSCMLPPVQPDFVESQQQQVVESVSTALDLSQTFSLNSLPGANYTIYLDFTGHTTSGTNWNTYFTDGANIDSPAFDLDGNPESFSSSELETIQYIWQRVAEDFRPFNINVTTQVPADINDLIKSSSSDTRAGVRVVIGGSSYDWYGAGAGGVAYIGSFNWNSDTPAYVFTEQTGNGDEKATAEAISHEVGHTLGLKHDGRTSPSQSYYSGHGSGDTGWASIMGVGYYQNLTQWSKGEYASANNTEDDLQIITTKNGFDYRSDDCGDTIATAKSLTISGTSVSADGIIERNTDIDFYSFFTGTGSISLTVNPFSRGPNLDILAQLYNSAGNLIASSNPTDSLFASITTVVVAGTYYLAIDGTGKGDPLSGGYTDYGSLGQYFISGSIVEIPTITLALSPSSVNEDGTSNLVYTFTRSGSTTNALTVNYSVGGTASFNSDYSQSGASSFMGTSGTITFAAGASTATVTIDPTADTIIESDETVAVTLIPGSGYTIGTTTSVIGTITNDDLPSITLALSPSHVNEDGTSNLVYTFTRTGSTTNALTVSYSVGGTATFESDYSQSGASSFTSTTGTITFAAGASTATLTIDPTADTIIESDETFAVTLTSGNGYTISTTTPVTGIITNDDFQTKINLSTDQTIVEGYSKPQYVTYTVTLSIASSKTITVQYSTANGSATAGSDYTNTTGTLIFNPGVTSQVINVPILNDFLNEADKTFSLSLTSATNANLGTTTSVITTITDTLVTSFSASLPTNVENLTLNGTHTYGYGNASNNIIISNNTYNKIYGRDGDDTIIALAASDTLYGEGGNDTLIGSNGYDFFYGGTGDNVIEGGGGSDILSQSGDFNFTLTNTQLIGLNTDTFTGIETVWVWGGSSANILDASTLSIASCGLYGGAGNDTLLGGSYFSNTLQGDDGDDYLIGGTAHDVFFPGAGDDIIDGGGGGNDRLYESGDVNFILTNTQLIGMGTDIFTNIETVFIGGGNSANVLDASAFTIGAYSFSVRLDGGGGNDTLLGSINCDIFLAGDGDDLINGGAGSDTLYGEGGADTFVLAPGNGNDTIGYFEDGIDKLGLSGGLTYGALTISANGNNTSISITSTNKLLATLSDINPSLINENDFIPINT